MVMRFVGFKVLKNKLRESVGMAAGGERVLVTDRARVVAEIVPPQAGRSPLLVDALLAEAVREGWLTPPTLTGGPPPRKPVASFRDLMGELRQDRDEPESNSAAPGRSPSFRRRAAGPPRRCGRGPRRAPHHCSEVG